MIDSNSSGKIKFTLAGALASFKHVTDSFRQGAEFGRWCIGHLVNHQTVILVGIVHLWKISGIHFLIRSFNELCLPNSVIISHVLNAILFQEMVHFPRILALEELGVNSVTLSGVKAGRPCIVRPAIKDAPAG